MLLIIPQGILHTTKKTQIALPTRSVIYATSLSACIDWNTHLGMITRACHHRQLIPVFRHYPRSLRFSTSSSKMWKLPGTCSYEGEGKQCVRPRNLWFGKHYDLTLVFFSSTGTECIWENNSQVVFYIITERSNWVLIALILEWKLKHVTLQLALNYRFNYVSFHCMWCNNVRINLWTWVTSSRHKIAKVKSRSDFGKHRVLSKFSRFISGNGLLTA